MSRARRALGAVVLVALVAAPLSVTPTATARPVKAGSCAGFTNKTGMTRSVIRIGNTVDRSGPVPGLYLGARQAVRAYVAYFNAHHRICGRRLVLDAYDSRTDAGGDRTATRATCAKDFASVGSMSLADDGGAASARSCRLPDLRATSSTTARNACTTCFGVEATRAGEAPNSVPDYVVAQQPAAAAKAALLYLNAGSVPARAATLLKVDEARGVSYVYSAGIDVADFNYSPYVAALASKGVRLVRFVGPAQQAARLALAMQSAGYHPDVFLADGVYGTDYARLAGAAGEGTVAAIDSLPLDSSQAQVRLYRTWLAKVVPGAAPTREGLFAWSAAALFTKEAISLGAKLSRRTLVGRLRTVSGWTGGGMHVPMAVGAKHVSPCVRLLVLHGGRWSALGGSAYRCSGVTRVG
jgi:ABC-type branched-subunit amino acid transport system substrate-binding protein